MDTVPPSLTALVTPPTTSTAPASTALFLFRCSEAQAVVQWRCVAVNSTALSPGGPCTVVPPDASPTTALSNTSAPWSRAAGVAGVALSSLSSGVLYGLAAACVDPVGNVGPEQTWAWQSGACPTPDALLARAVTQVGVVALGPGDWAVTWNASQPRAEGSGGGAPWVPQFEVVVLGLASAAGVPLDGPGASDAVLLQTTTPDAFLRLPPAVAVPGAWRTVVVRVAVPPGCSQAAGPQPSVAAPFFVPGPCPGSPGLVSTPTVSSSSVFGDFVLNSTCPQDWFQYSLDGSSWAGCSSPLRVGPLASGVHALRVRTVNSSGVGAGPEVTFQWSVVSSSDSTLSLSDLTDAAHELSVAALDAYNNRERVPRRFTWVVDGVPPTTVVQLLTPAVTAYVHACVRCLGGRARGRWV